MSDIANKVREIGTVTGIHPGILQELEATLWDEDFRIMPEIVAAEFDSIYKYPQVHAAYDRASRLYFTARM